MQYEAKCSKRFLMFRLEQHTTMNLALIPFMNSRKSGRRLFSFLGQYYGTYHHSLAGGGSTENWVHILKALCH